MPACKSHAFDAGKQKTRSELTSKRNSHFSSPPCCKSFDSCSWLLYSNRLVFLIDPQRQKLVMKRRVKRNEGRYAVNIIIRHNDRYFGLPFGGGPRHHDAEWPNWTPRMDPQSRQQVWLIPNRVGHPLVRVAMLVLHWYQHFHSPSHSWNWQYQYHVLGVESWVASCVGWEPTV